MMAMKRVIGHDDLGFLISASVSNSTALLPAPTMALVQAMSFGFVRVRPDLNSRLL